MAKGLHLGTETGSLVNHIASRVEEDKPEVGKGCTILCWTDRIAGTIIKVTDKTFTVQEDSVERTDKNGCSEIQEYKYSRNPNGKTWVFRQTKRGWRSNGTGVWIGIRQQYHDFSF